MAIGSSMQSWRFEEIVVRVMPTPSDMTEPAPPQGTKRARGRAVEPAPRSYDALIYSNLDLPQLSSGSPQFSLPSGQPSDFAGLALVAVERFQIRWSRYEEYLATFIEGTRDPVKMRYNLFQALSPGLEQLFLSPPPAPGPVRVWLDSQAIELVDLPWELLFYAGDRPPSAGWSLVRGLPPASPPPLVPVQGPLRLALIHDPDQPLEPLRRALARLRGFRTVPFTGPPREALQTAVREGYELLHIIADGVVSLAYEGSLYLHDPVTPALPVSELSQVLRGSRVTVLGLTSTTSLDPDRIAIGGRLVPSAYRAFAYLAGVDLPLPSIVAPLGPTDIGVLGEFWRGFYRGLAGSFSIEEAMAAGRTAAAMPVGMALFLRHPQGRLFRQAAVAKSAAPEMAAPNRIAAEVQTSQSLVSRLEKLKAQYGELPASVAELLDEEIEHHDRLSAELEPWTQLEAGER